jgi:hypothetical protein
VNLREKFPGLIDLDGGNDESDEAEQWKPNAEV